MNESPMIITLLALAGGKSIHRRGTIRDTIARTVTCSGAALERAVLGDKAVFHPRRPETDDGATVINIDHESGF